MTVLVSGARTLASLNRRLITNLSNNSLFFLRVRTFTVTTSRNMKLVQFYHNNNPKEVRVGFLLNNNVIDINKANSSLPTNLLDILRNGDIEKVKQLSSNPSSYSNATVPTSSVTLTAPIRGVDKILCVALNYADHCKEQNLTPPPVAVIFSKFSSTIIGPDQALRLRTDMTKKVDWEVELAVVIGKTASYVKAADAYDYVLGYTVAQDISSRDWQKDRNGGQFLLGKSQDTFCPIGPCIVTKDEIPDPQVLDIKCSINGDIKQNSNTNNLIHKIPDVIERISSLMTLLPGDLLLTGTPGGVGLYRNPQQFLQPGDVLTSEIQNIGVLETKVEKF